METQPGKKQRIKVTADGPYLVLGGVALNSAQIAPDQNDYLLAWKKTQDFPHPESYKLCRCGQSKHKPFCDSTHRKIKFDGTETAENIPYRKQAEEYAGPKLVLLDAVQLCASGHFCTRAGGTWDLVEQRDDPEAKRLAQQEVADCPSGRLVLLDKKTGKEIEPAWAPEITVAEDTLTGTLGPLWVKGKIPIESADGQTYELRSRVTLCRCGRSGNKPLCDGEHVNK